MPALPRGNRLSVPDSYSLLLALFACALQGHFLLTAKGGFVIPLLVLLFNYRFWTISLIQILLATFYLIPAFPRLANHANLETVVSVIILALFIKKYLGHKIHLTPALTSGLFRNVTICMYFFSGFHKLNADFFNSSVSCVKEYWSAPITEMFAALNCQDCNATLLKLPFPLLTIVLEMGLPFGLLWRKTRILTVILLLLFHAYLSLHGLLNFGALAVFMLTGSVLNFEQQVAQKMARGLRIYLCAIMSSALFYFFAIIRVPGFDWSLVPIFSAIAFSVALVCFFGPLFKENKSADYVITKKQTSILFAVFCLMSVWSLKNYVGLGTTGNFTMFSNISTEKSRSNHFLINTEQTKIWDFEEDFVQLIELDHNLKLQAPQRASLLSSLIPVVQLSWLIRKWSNETPDRIRCKLIYKGQKIEIKDLKNSQFAEYYWWYHYLPFRPFQITGPSDCRW